MNILFYLSNYPGYGGIEKVTTILANYFVTKLGYSVSILSVKQSNEDELLTELDRSVRFYKLSITNRHDDSNNVVLLNSLIRNNKIDVLIYQDSYAPTEKLLYKIANDIKPYIIIVEHNTPDSFKSSIYNWKNDKCLNILDFVKKITFPFLYLIIYLNTRNRHIKLIEYSDKYIVLSNKFIQILSKVFCIRNSNKIIAIGNPITIKNSNLEKKEKCCIFVGRLTSQKGIDKLLKIWRIVEVSQPEWKLKIVGDGELKQFVENYISKYNIKNISLEGFHVSLIPYYQEASILLMTSVFEGWGLVLTEAMSYGVVPIAFNSYASVSEIINNDINGILVKPFNVNEYSKIINELINNDNKRNLLSMNAIDKSKQFSIEIIAKKWIDIFNL